MVLAEVKDGAGQQEEGGARGEGAVAYSWLSCHPRPQRKHPAAHPGLCGPGAQHPSLVFPLFP